MDGPESAPLATSSATVTDCGSGYGKYNEKKRESQGDMQHVFPPLSLVLTSH